MFKCKMQILNKFLINHNVMRVSLKSLETLPEMQISSFISISNHLGVAKSYTPIKVNDNTIELIIKIYKDGTVSEFLYNLSIGDFVDVVGFYEKKPFIINEHRNILMIAGGSGVAPMIQILQRVLPDRENKTKFTLLFLNRTKEDVFIDEGLAIVDLNHKIDLKETINGLYYRMDNLEKENDKIDLKEKLESSEIENSSQAYKNKENPIQTFKSNENLKIINFITREINPDGGGFKIDHLKNIVDSIDFDYIYVCGPPGMMESVCGTKTKDKQQGELRGMLKDLGFNSDKVYKF